VKSFNVIELSPSASVKYAPRFLNPDTSKTLLEKWKSELDWEQSEIFLFGRTLSIPRLNAWYGDKAYAYSGTQFDAKPLTRELATIKTQVEKASGLLFNSVLINWYRDGQDSMGWHSDDEKSLGENPQIASISFGDSRRFLLRHKKDKSKKYEIVLEDCSLLLMLGNTQSVWQHAVPKTAKPKSDRINLTFRLIL